MMPEPHGRDCVTRDEMDRELKGLHHENVQRMEAIAREQRDVRERAVRMEANLASMYGNGSGRRGYLENMEARWNEKWEMQLRENAAQARWRHEIAGKLEIISNRNLLADAEEDTQRRRSANFRGRLSLIVPLLGAAMSAVTAILIRLLERHGF